MWSPNPNICIPHRTPTLLTTTHFTLRFLLKRPQCQGVSDHLYNEDTSESNNQVTRGTRVVSFPTFLTHCFQLSCFLSALGFFHVFLHERFKYFASATSDECINIHVKQKTARKKVVWDVLKGCVSLLFLTTKSAPCWYAQKVVISSFSLVTMLWLKPDCGLCFVLLHCHCGESRWHAMASETKD